MERLLKYSHSLGNMKAYQPGFQEDLLGLPQPAPRLEETSAPRPLTEALLAYGKLPAEKRSPKLETKLQEELARWKIDPSGEIKSR